MAYRRKSYSGRRAPARGRTYSRSTRARRAPSRVRGRSQSGRAQTVKIVVQQVPASPVAVPSFGGYAAEKPDKPGKSKF